MKLKFNTELNVKEGMFGIVTRSMLPTQRLHKL